MTDREPGVSSLALVACWLAVLVRVLLVVGLIGVPVAFLIDAVEEWIYLFVLGPFVFLMAAYIGLAFTLRCPACRRRFLVESRGSKHPEARKAQPFSHYSTMVLDIIGHRRFTCMYCGILCRVG
jgi:DNA-directed RNA polymerase subunit RPC12/RpoP